MGPKTVALLWDATKIAGIDQLAEAIDAGRLGGLPRIGAKQIEKLRKGIEDYRRNAGRFRIDVAEDAAERISAYLLAFPGIDQVTPAGSLRRGRETAGDLDLLVTGPACAPEHTAAAVEYVAAFPGLHDTIAKGENKVSFHLANGLQVDVRLLPTASYGAALQYFTGSKAHNVALRQRALKMGYTLSEWALARLDDDSTVAAATEEEIYTALGMDWIPPELRENLGEIEQCRPARVAAPRRVGRPARRPAHAHHRHRRPQLHPRNGRGRPRLRLRIHRHHRPLQVSGHDQRPGRKRALEQIQQIREVDRQMEGRIRVFTGIEVDILADGVLDLDDEVLAQMDVVIASVHTRFDQSREEMTGPRSARHREPLRAHPRPPHGPPVLRREAYASTWPWSSARSRTRRSHGAQCRS